MSVLRAKVVENNLLYFRIFRKKGRGLTTRKQIIQRKGGILTEHAA